MRTHIVGMVLLGLTLSLTGAHCASGRPNPQEGTCSVEPADFHGWKAEQMANSWTTLTIIPQLGGRLMQVNFGGHDYLFVNPEYYGQYIPPAEGAAKGKWFNYGGDKDWPLPEGIDDEQHWPGARSDLLDDGEYSFSILSQGTDCAVRLDGPPDPRTGLQYSRVIGLNAYSPRITFHAVMKNATGHPIDWSVQSVSQYDTSDPQDRSQYNHHFWAFTPVNPDSAYEEGYRVVSGPSDHPSFSVCNGSLFTLHWAYIEAEVWLDSPVGWVAVVDGLRQYAMVERFKFERAAPYPGKATVIFYLNGASLHLDSNGMPALPPLDVLHTPYYMEAELNSPIAHLTPGETYAFDTEWFPARVGEHFKAANDAGVVSDPMKVTRTPNGLHLTGAYGVFYPGRLVAHLYDGEGVHVNDVALMNVSPLDVITLDKTIEASPTVAWLSIHLEDEQGRDTGELDEAHVNPQESIQLK